jgi:antibiotic biosynthesis monooxygenase (ABM) superfamily enzyme
MLSSPHRLLAEQAALGQNAFSRGEGCNRFWFHTQVVPQTSEYFKTPITTRLFVGLLVTLSNKKLTFTPACTTFLLKKRKSQQLLHTGNNSVFSFQFFRS